MSQQALLDHREGGVWSEALLHMPTPAYVIDVDGNQLLMNEAMEEFVGVDSEAAAEMELWELMRTDETHDTRTTLLDVAMENGEPIDDTEVQILTHDDEMRDVVVSLAPLTDDEGEVIAGTAGFEDVTDLRETERELNETKERVADDLGHLAATQEKKAESMSDSARSISDDATEQAEKLQEATAVDDLTGELLDVATQLRENVERLSGDVDADDRG